MYRKALRRWTIRVGDVDVDVDGDEKKGRKNDS